MTLIAIGGNTDSGIGGPGSFVKVQNVEILGADIGVKPGGDRWEITGCRTQSVGWAVMDGIGTLFTLVYNNNFATGGAGVINIDFSVGWRIESNHMAAAIEGNPSRDIHIADNQFMTSSPTDHTAAIFIGGANGAERIEVVNNQLWDLQDDAIHFDGVQTGVISGNMIHGNDGENGIILDGCSAIMVQGNSIRDLSFHGIQLIDSSKNIISDNRLQWIGGDTANTYDAVTLSGTSDGNLICDNFVNPVPEAGSLYVLRYGINIAGAGNVVVGNHLGTVSDYGTDAINDGGTGTILNFPNTIYGDNFTDTAAVPGGPNAVSQLTAFTHSGVLSVMTGTNRLPWPFDATLASVKAAVGTAPTDADIIVDIHKNGTTVFTTQANRPTITDGTNVSDNETPDVTAITAGEYLTVDIDQVGSTIPGEDLTVVIEWRMA